MADYAEDATGVAAIQYASNRYAARVAAEIEQDMVDLCPVDTGALRDSIRAEQVEDTVYIWVGGGPVGYALYVEYGTRYMRAQPFIRPALIRRRDVVYGDDFS